MACEAVGDVLESFVMPFKCLGQFGGFGVIRVTSAVEQEQRRLNPIDEVDGRKGSVSARFLLWRSAQQRGENGPRSRILPVVCSPVRWPEEVDCGRDQVGLFGDG